MNAGNPSQNLSSNNSHTDIARFDLATIRASVRSELPAVRLVVLFGSRATGKATERSDWDIGVLPAAGTYLGFEQLILQDKVAQILDLPNSRMDFVDLRTCSPVLGYAIAIYGKPLYQENDITFTRFCVKAMKKYADTAKFRQMQRAALGFNTTEFYKDFFDISGLLTQLRPNTSKTASQTKQQDAER